jgi:amidase
VVPLAPSFDTVGWLSKSPLVLRRIAEVLLPASIRVQDAERAWKRAWTLDEAEALTDGETRGAIADLVSRLGLPTRPLTGLTVDFGGLEGLRKVYATVQGWEAWQTHGEWIAAQSPSFAPAITARFEVASRITREEVDSARDRLVRFRAALRSALTEAVLILPAAAGPAPLVGEDAAVVDEVRTRTMRLTSPAGLGGLPQLTVPFRGADGLPRGVGLLGSADSDLSLIDLAIRVAEDA